MSASNQHCFPILCGLPLRAAHTPHVALLLIVSQPRVYCTAAWQFVTL